jgi:hypothetical protein
MLNAGKRDLPDLLHLWCVPDAGGMSRKGDIEEKGAEFRRLVIFYLPISALHRFFETQRWPDFRSIVSGKRCTAAATA